MSIYNSGILTRSKKKKIEKNKLNDNDIDYNPNSDNTDNDYTDCSDSNSEISENELEDLKQDQITHNLKLKGTVNTNDEDSEDEYYVENEHFYIDEMSDKDTDIISNILKKYIQFDKNDIIENDTEPKIQSRNSNMYNKR